MKKILSLAVAFLPGLALAQNNFTNIQSGIASVASIVDRLIPLVIGIAVLLFLIGVLRFVTAGGDEEKREAARNMIIFGIIALFVMVCVWGFVRILKSSIFGGGDATTPVEMPRVIIPN